MKKQKLLVFPLVLSLFVSGCGLTSSDRESKLEEVIDHKQDAVISGNGTVEAENIKYDSGAKVATETITNNENLIVANEEVSLLDVSREENDKCEFVYQDLLKLHGREFNDCRGEAFTVDCEGADRIGKKNNLILIFDSSGSMAGVIGGEAKIDIAKKAVNNFLSNFPAETNLAMLMYGHVGSNRYADKQKSCDGIELKYALSTVNAVSVKTAVNEAKPVGWTPIALTLEKAKVILANYDSDNYNNTVLLVTDGIETCDGDPVVKAKELYNSGAGVVIDVIGFDVYGDNEDKLKAIAAETGGKYYPARSAYELESTLNQYSKTYCHGLKKYAWGVSKSQLDGAWSACQSRLGEERSDFATAYSEIERDCYPYVSNRYIERRDSVQAELDQIIEDNKKYLESINPAVE